MTPNPRTKAWQGLIRLYIVGWHDASETAKMVSVPNSGTMICDGQRADANRSSPEHEAQVVFGLSQIRSFLPGNVEGMKEYVAALNAENTRSSE